VDGHGGSSEWTIAIVVRLRARRLQKFDLRQASACGSEPLSVKRNVVRVARGRATVFARRDAGEGMEFAVEVGLVAVAASQRQFRPGQRWMRCGLRQQRARNRCTRQKRFGVNPGCRSNTAMKCRWL
jgi:hypothetical protein